MDDISKELYEKIKKEFDKSIKNDSELNKISKTIESGSATYKEANEFTKRLTELLAKSVNKYANENTLPNGHFYQNIGDAVLEPLLRQCYEEIAKRCASVQKAINDMATINIKPQEPEYDEYRSYEVVNRANSFPVYNEEAQKSTEKTMESTNYNYVDKSIQKNAEFQTSSGLTATVTRRYDGVGLHDGKQACQWCLSRAGSNVPYREAKQRGMFERHEGCGCTIEYTSAKGIRTFQNGKSRWYDEADKEKRKELAQNILRKKSAAERLFDSMNQDGDIAKIPPSAENDFSNWNQLKISKQQSDILRTMMDDSIKNNVENLTYLYSDGTVITESVREHGRVRVDLTNLKPHTIILHSHTSYSPFSLADFSWLNNPNVDEIMVVLPNGDVYTASGITDNLTNLQKYEILIKEDVDSYIKDVYPDIYVDEDYYWYHYCQERNYRLKNYYELEMGGGKLEK